MFATAGTGKTITGTINSGKTNVTLTVDVIAAELTSVTWKTQPTKKEYVVGQNLDVTGGMLTATYNSGKTKEVALTAAMVSGFNSAATAAKQTLTVSYTEGTVTKTAAYDISVVAKQVTKFTLTAPTQKEYIEDKEDTLNLDGGSIAIEYNDGTTETVAMDQAAVTGYDKTKVGSQTITVTYLGAYDTFAISVVKKKPVSMTVTAVPKQDYIEGQSLDLTSGSMTVTYDNGKTGEVALSRCTATGYDSSKIGSQTLLASYTEESATVTADLSVTVRRKAVKGFTVTAPTKVQYVAGQDLNPAGGKLAVTYDNDTTAEVDLTADMLSGYDKTKIGGQKVTVTYQQKTGTFDVTVIAKAIDHITMKTAPKTAYIIREALDVTNGVITEVYNDESTVDAALTAAMCSGFDSSKVTSNVTVTVTDSGKTLTYTISVRDRSIQKIEVMALPAKTEYIEGQTLNLAGGTFRITYDNGETETKDISEAQCTADMSSAGTGRDVTVSYGGKTATYQINIAAKKATAVAWAVQPAAAETTWKEGMDFKYSGKAKITYDNGTDEIVSVSSDRFTLSGYDKTKIGSQNVTLALTADTSLTLPETVQVLEKALVRIEADPSKVNYIVGGTVSSSDVASIAVYDNGTTEVIPADKTKLTAPDISSISLSSIEAGLPVTKTVTVTYQGKTVTYQIDVYPVGYQITEGNQANLVQNAGGSQIFRSNAENSKFVEFRVDGKKVDDKNFDCKSGSTIITLHADYISSLTVGTHTMDVISNDGKASGTFSVSANAAKASSSAQPASAAKAAADTSGRNTTWCITYLDCRGNTVSVQWVPYGGSPVAPAGYRYPVVSNVSAHQSVRPNSCSADSRYVVPNTADKG